MIGRAAGQPVRSVAPVRTVLASRFRVERGAGGNASTLPTSNRAAAVPLSGMHLRAGSVTGNRCGGTPEPTQSGGVQTGTMRHPAASPHGEPRPKPPPPASRMGSRTSVTAIWSLPSARVGNPSRQPVFFDPGEKHLVVNRAPAPSCSRARTHSDPPLVSPIGK